MVIDLLADPDIRREDLTSLRTVGGGGTTMPAKVAEKLKALPGIDYIEGYGMTGTMTAVIINPLDAPRRQCWASRFSASMPLSSAMLAMSWV